MTSALGKLARASWSERRALVRAAVLLVAVRTALLTLPLRTVLRMAERAGGRGTKTRPAGHAASAGNGGADADPDLRRIIWAVEVMGNRLFPKNPCLTQALVVQVLFRRAGRPADLRIGVRRDTEATPQAHAWVESEGVILIGHSEALQGYVTLPPLPVDG